MEKKFVFPLMETWIKVEKEEKTNSYTRILRRSHDQQDSREGTSQRIFFSQRYHMMFNGYCYKWNNYGHKAIHCRDHEKITPRRNQGGFSVQCYNCYHYGHFAKHCRCRDKLKFGEESKLNRMTWTTIGLLKYGE